MACLPEAPRPPRPRATRRRPTARRRAARAATAASVKSANLAAKQSRPRSVVVDGDTLYWTNSDAGGTHGYSLLKTSLAGGEETVLDASLETPWALAKLGQQLAWTALGGESLLGSVAVTDLGTGATRVLAKGQAWPGSVAIDAEAVYWASEYDDRLQKVGTCTCQP